jgi:hypothetical protein
LREPQKEDLAPFRLPTTPPVSPHQRGGRLPSESVAALPRIPHMGTKTTFVCDCCLREADNNLGRARVSVNGASDGKQLMPDDNRDLCEICWSPLLTLMKKVHDEAREKRNASGKP